jgi:hypothetical protein
VSYGGSRTKVFVSSAPAESELASLPLEFGDGRAVRDLALNEELFCEDLLGGVGDSGGRIGGNDRDAGPVGDDHVVGRDGDAAHLDVATYFFDGDASLSRFWRVRASEDGKRSLADLADVAVAAVDDQPPSMIAPFTPARSARTEAFPPQHEMPGPTPSTTRTRSAANSSSSAYGKLVFEPASGAGSNRNVWARPAAVRDAAASIPAMIPSIP